MCGRAAQTISVVNIAARNFASSPCQNASSMPSTSTSTSTSASAPGRCDPMRVACNEDGLSDNFNLSPGMDCVVILVNENGEFQVDRKKWGLISKSGTTKKPLYTDEKDIIKMCFESLCYNARSDTLYSKPTFSKLAHRGQTCIIVLDGYFEWKSHPLPKMNKRKQPYFVYRKQQPDHDAKSQQREREPLMIAGLWTKVATGIPNAPELDSFAMLTTEASKQIEWLHHRMPVCIWDVYLAKRWLTKPSEALKKELDDAARRNNNGFAWHKVTPEMSKLTFRSKEAIKEMKETTQSVKHFFAVDSSTAKIGKEETRRLSSFEEGKGQNFDIRGKNSTVRTKLSSDTVVDNKSTVTAAAAIPKVSSSTTRDRKRESTSSTTAHFPPTKKLNSSKSKSKSSRSTTSYSNNKQISISSFFQKKK